MKEVMKEMINWQKIWDDDGNKNVYIPVKVIASILSFFYLGVINFRNWLYDHKIFKEMKLPCPVISVGNITVGGTGKTPCVIMLARMLQKNGFKPAVISRGYGSKSINPVNIISDGDKILLDSETAGDEPYLIAQELKNVPVITGAKRIATGETAINQFGVNVLICDDAMQHRQIFRDINLVLLDNRSLSGKDHVLPRGRLREPIKELGRADAIILTRTDETQQIDKIIGEIIRTKNIPVFKSIHKPKDIIRGNYNAREPVSELKGKKVYAFCGIANPDSFKKILLVLETKILSFDIFPDHYRYDKSELEKIRTGFISCHADYLVTTQKDAVRLKDNPEFLKMLSVLRVEMEMIPSAQLFEKYIMEQIKFCQVKQ
ncbi:MAG: tetraacyldisaccharide 4'-kinase [Deltaproteobacteria bacterium HGW-Deltaproteobacteria-10]|nr:MAG: tetraacyldisaccharide 4'-kinase [Deltaproteobacteria bacterium HGW-Deltaproteobacteria-10]